MTRFVIGGFVTVCAATLVATAAGGAAAPVPKDAGKADPTPDLKAFFSTVGKAVESEKWPAEADEKLLRDTARVIFERAVTAAEQKDRKLPVDFEKLTKADVAKEFRSARLEGTYLIAGDVRITSAKNSVIFASGNVQITGADNCIVIARNVRCTAVDNSVLVAGEFIRITSAWRRDREGSGSVLVAGQWIRATGLDGTICHVLRPGTSPAPGERENEQTPHPAIRTNGAENVIFLNAMEETGANGPKNCTYLPPKTSIAK